MLVNLQPYGKPINLEVRLGDERRQVGIAWDSVEKLGNMNASLRELVKSVTAGLFALRHEAHWQFEMWLQTPADWQGFLDRPSFGSVEADQELLDSALAHPDGYVVTTEDDLAQSYERLV